MISTSIHGIVQNGSVLFFDENTITIHCTISNPTYTVEWYYRTLIDGNVTDVTSLSIFSPQTGISSLDVNFNQLGYYDCIINRASVYSVYLVHNSSLSKLMRYMYCIPRPAELVRHVRQLPDHFLTYAEDFYGAAMNT